MLADQASKLYIKGFSFPFLNIHHEGVGAGYSVPVIGDYFRITYVENPGMAFGIEITPVTKLLVSLFSLIASIGLLYYLYKVRKQSLTIRIPLALILAGAIGNLIDRMFYGIFYDYAPLFHGRVIDFLHFSYGTHSFPIFNIADSAVTVGVIALLLFYKQHEDTPGTLATEKNLESAENITSEAQVTSEIPVPAEQPLAAPQAEQQPNTLAVDLPNPLKPEAEKQ